MRAAVVVFPGSNADSEMIRTVRDVAGIPTEVSWHADSKLPADVDLVILPGGFSYGDYLRSGAIAKVSPIMQDVRRHAERGGLVLGVCNGFQILVETGLLPGALTRNLTQRFICKEVCLKVASAGPFTEGLADRVVRLPIAHGDGRYLPPIEPGAFSSENVALVYSTSAGEVSAAANPNGSVANVAGVYGGPRRNVFGLMPHPERMSEPLHGGTDGRLFFEAAKAWHSRQAKTQLHASSAGAT